jgi:hypothetical protein
VRGGWAQRWQLRTVTVALIAHGSPKHTIHWSADEVWVLFSSCSHSKPEPWCLKLRDLLGAYRPVCPPAGPRRNTWRVATGRLNEGRAPNCRGVRVHVSTGYSRVEGNRRASRNGRVSDIPLESLRCDSQLLYARTTVRSERKLNHTVSRSDTIQLT